MKRHSLDFASTSCVDAFKLIRQVKKNDVLYNKETHGYSDLNGKELVWEDIHKNLFPGYEDFDDETKGTIRKLADDDDSIDFSPMLFVVF